MGSPPRRLLFILDLNGTLLHRLTKSGDRKLANLHPKSRSSDCTVNGNPIYFRPGHYSLLEKLLQVGDVAVWTSAMPKNAIPMILHTFKGLLDIDKVKELSKVVSREVEAYLPTFEQPTTTTTTTLLQGKFELKFIWTQNECDILRRFNSIGKPEFRKDLSRVWEKFPAYNPTNTLILDDSIEKIFAHKENLLRLPEFIVTDSNVDFTLDQALFQLIDHVSQMSKENEMDSNFDVRNYLRQESPLFTKRNSSTLPPCPQPCLQ